jgi:uncharacterized protein YjiS (DUF1127 family)
MTTITTHAIPCPSREQAVGAGAIARLVALPRLVLETLLDWQERERQRHHLRQLDDRLLGDIGLSRADAVREASKPFWTP